MQRHNCGYERTTKPYAPFILIYKETLDTRKEARAREKYLKSGVGRELIKRKSDCAGLSADWQVQVPLLVLLS